MLESGAQAVCLGLSVVISQIREIGSGSTEGWISGNGTTLTTGHILHMGNNIGHQVLIVRCVISLVLLKGVSVALHDDA